MNFYQQLGSFGDFSEITEDRHYARVPDDWVVVVADIRGSTRAVEEGRYRDVNTLGAAAIVAVHNRLGTGTFPFVFGGDGATMVIPPDKLDTARRQLQALCLLARDRFDLSLQAGAVPVSELDGAHVEVAKLRIAGKRTLAVFRGGGLSLAEQLVKKEGSPHQFEVPVDAAAADLGGLSCRWLPVIPSRGVALSLLVRSKSGTGAYQKVLSAIAALYGGKLEQANPINREGARYRSVRQCLEDERRYHRSPWSLKFAWRMFEIICAVMIFRHGVPSPIDAEQYARSMGRHSDYRKFDDMLRMVIDCSQEQADQLRKLLESMHEQGEIDYGMHLAKESLMTCFFHGAGDGKHIHFVDGGDGGYVMAAKQLKRQMHA